MLVRLTRALTREGVSKGSALFVAKHFLVCAVVRLASCCDLLASSCEGARNPREQTKADSKVYALTKGDSPITMNASSLTIRLYHTTFVLLIRDEEE